MRSPWHLYRDELTIFRSSFRAFPGHMITKGFSTADIQLQSKLKSCIFALKSCGHVDFDGVL